MTESSAAADVLSAAGGAMSAEQHATLERVLRVAYPHEKLPDGPYQRTAQAIVESEPEPGLVADAIRRLDAACQGGFASLDAPDATRALRAIQATPFFRHVAATAVVSLYDDSESWAALGYEGASFDKGGYLERGFDDLDWLPDPRIDENADETMPDVVATWGDDK